MAIWVFGDTPIRKFGDGLKFGENKDGTTPPVPPVPTPEKTKLDGSKKLDGSWLLG